MRAAQGHHKTVPCRWRQSNTCCCNCGNRRAAVLAGPVEATAIGNVLIQAGSRAGAGELSELRTLVARTFPPAEFQPR